jgi:Rod binding domain-containing protein
MLKELLKPLAAGDSLTGAADGDGSGSAGILGEFASEALGKGLSEHGGFGIANRILSQLSRSGNSPGTDGVTADTHFNTELGTF